MFIEGHHQISFYLYYIYNYLYVFFIGVMHAMVVLIYFIKGHIGNNCDFDKIQHFFDILKYHNTCQKLVHSSRPMALIYLG